ncbi:hypothetical protein [Paraburkholderia youngii]|nr:hypothetical protein [Paraburkholderia youngii]
MNRAVRAGEAALVERGFFIVRGTWRVDCSSCALCAAIKNQIVVPADVMI